VLSSFPPPDKERSKEEKNKRVFCKVYVCFLVSFLALITIGYRVHVKGLRRIFSSYEDFCGEGTVGKWVEWETQVGFLQI
jgi:hypothetical protein